MSIFFNHNGKLYAEGTAIIGADNRGLRFGDGLFETMKFRHAALLFADDHFARLWRGLQLLQFDIPKHFSPDTLEAAIISLVKKNKHDNLARVRLTVFRGDGGLYDPKNHQPNYIIQSWKLPRDNGQWNSNGLVLGLYAEVKKSCDLLSNLKHNNFLPYAMAALKAKQEKWNDALILNTYNRVCDSSIANIFFIKDEKVYTPALGEGCVAGIMRSNIIRCLKEHDLTVIESEVTTEELLDADELFLTNSMYNLRWVKQFENKIYSNVFTKKNYAQLSAQLNW